MNKYHQPILPGETYHLFNRAIGNESLFKTDEDYHYFLMKYNEHLGNVCNTYCYCLLPNHFHFLIRFNNIDSIINQYQKFKKKLPLNIDSSFLSDFTKRICVENDSAFSKIIHYVHANPVHHGLVNKIED